MKSKPELQNVMPSGGFRRGEIQMIVAKTRLNAPFCMPVNLSELEERVLANIPKRVATIPASEDADCLFCNAVFKTTVEASAGKHTTCPVCKSYHQYGQVVDGEVAVTALKSQI